MNRATQQREDISRAWTIEMVAAHRAKATGDVDRQWRQLERAHVLSQPMVRLHLRTHLAMLAFAIRRHDRHEIAGQLLRLVLAGPGSLAGRYPSGNTGGAAVSAFAVMPIPEDLRSLLAPEPVHV